MTDKYQAQEQDPLVDMGLNLVVARKVKGMTQLDLVTKAEGVIAHLSQDKLSKIEHQKVYDYTLAEQFANILGVSFEFLTKGVMEKVVTSATIEGNTQTNTNAADGYQDNVGVNAVVDSDNSGNITNNYNYPPEHIKELIDKIIETTDKLARADAEKASLLQEVKELEKKLSGFEKNNN